MRSTLRRISFNKKVAEHTPRKSAKLFPWKKLLAFFIGTCIVVFGGAWIYLMQGVPSLDKLESDKFFKESTIIYDKDGNEIYTIFKDGKRTNIPYTEISQSIIDATVSTEDRTFFENPGIDILGLVRVGATYVTGGRFGRIGGASTISQQLIKNTLLTNEVTIKRKAQEAFLSYRMNKLYSKEKILEMYLNTISFGHNANGIEQASKTFFGKSAKDVGPLGATILASVINAPTRYSPYIHRDRVMGKLEVYPISDTTDKVVLETIEQKELYAPLYNEFKSYLSGITVERKDFGATICGVKENYIKSDYAGRSSFLPDNDGCSDVGYESLGDFFGNISFSKVLKIKDTQEEYAIEYTIGRKDFVAKQLLEDDKIDGDTYKKIIYDGIDFEFKKYVESIKYPHFVMYVKEYLETKYGKDMDITSGLKVYTTIDPALQEKAEEIIKKQVETNKKLHGVSNAALVSMNNIDGKILAWVGGVNYFDTENKGNNDMVIAKSIRPGSSFKPLVYAIALSKNPIGGESPVADVYTDFGGWDPDNYDGKFNGVMMTKNALNYSRNIPAVKMYYLAGGQDAIVDVMRSMGVNTLKKEAEQKKGETYGASMALGTAEIKPVELMQAYSVLANNGVKNDAYFIEKIATIDGAIIEEHKSTEGKEVFSPAASYIINKMISDNSSRPESSYWRNALTINGKNVAAKTGTADGKTKTGKKYPRDLWTIGYSPQITTVVWAGSTTGNLLNSSAESLNSAAPIWKAYMEFALKDLPKAEWKKPEGVYTYNIVKTSGKLATKDTPKDQTVSTVMAVKFDDYDDGVKELQIDTLCNGIATDATPPDAIKLVYIPSGKPIIDGYDPEWTSSFYAALKKGQTGTGAIDGVGSDEYSDKPCDTRPEGAGSVTILIDRSNDTTATIRFTGDRMIQKVRITPNGGEGKEVVYGSGAIKDGTVTINVRKGENVDILVEAIDIYGFKYTKSSTILDVPTDSSTAIGGRDGDISPPEITMINPKGKNLNLYAGDPFNLRFRANISTTTREIQIFIDDKVQQTATSGEVFIIPMSSAGLSEGKHTVRITAIDGNFQTTEASFSITILPR